MRRPRPHCDRSTLELRNELKGAEIAAIKTGITKYAAMRIGDKYPTSIESAKFSMPLSRPTRRFDGPPTLSAFTEEAIDDQAVKALARKATVAVDPEHADFLDDSPTRVTVMLADGRTLERVRYYASGTVQMPLTREQVEENFFAGTERAVDKQSAAKASAFLDRIDEQRSFAELWGLVGRG